MIDRKTLKKGDVVWFAEISAGRVVCGKATVRQKPRGRGAAVWLKDGPKMCASEYQLFPTEEAALRRMLENAQESVDAAAADFRAAAQAWDAFGARKAEAEVKP